MAPLRKAEPCGESAAEQDSQLQHYTAQRTFCEWQLEARDSRQRFLLSRVQIPLCYGYNTSFHRLSTVFFFKQCRLFSVGFFVARRRVLVSVFIHEKKNPLVFS